MNFDPRADEYLRLGAMTPSSGVAPLFTPNFSSLNSQFIPQQQFQPLQNHLMGDLQSFLGCKGLLFPSPLMFNHPKTDQNVSSLRDGASLSQQMLMPQSGTQFQYQQNLNLSAVLHQLQSQQQQQQQQQQQLQQQFLGQGLPAFTWQQQQQSNLMQQQRHQQSQTHHQQQQQYQSLELYYNTFVNSQQQQTQLNNQISQLLAQNHLSPQSNLPRQVPPHQVKEEEHERDEEIESDLPNEEQEEEEEDQLTAQESPLKKEAKRVQLLSQTQDQDQRARASTAPLFVPINDYQKFMMQTPIPLGKKDSSSLYTASSQQKLATQQIINNSSVSCPTPLLPEFVLPSTSIVLPSTSVGAPKINIPTPSMKASLSAKVNQGLIQARISCQTYSREEVNELKWQMGVKVRDRETLAPFLEQWNAREEGEQVLQRSYALLKTFPGEGTEAFEEEFRIEYIEQGQKCNYVNKFINSKGLIVKDEKLGKIKIENKISRFHNLSRLLMYTILTAFHRNNLTLMNLETLRQEAILKMIQRLKQSARKKTPKGLIKTDFFNHTHYNVLFLTINEYNIEHIRKNAKDVATHMKVFNFDMHLPYHTIKEDIRYSNIIKKLAYHIMLASYKKSKDDKKDSDLSNSSNSTYREQYIDRAMLGITKLNQGVLIQRF